MYFGLFHIDHERCLTPTWHYSSRNSTEWRQRDKSILYLFKASVSRQRRRPFWKSGLEIWRRKTTRTKSTRNTNKKPTNWWGPSETLRCQLKFRAIWILTSFLIQGQGHRQAPFWHCWTPVAKGYHHKKTQPLLYRIKHCPKFMSNLTLHFI